MAHCMSCVKAGLEIREKIIQLFILWSTHMLLLFSYCQFIISSKFELYIIWQYDSPQKKYPVNTEMHNSFTLLLLIVCNLGGWINIALDIQLLYMIPNLTIRKITLLHKMMAIDGTLHYKLTQSKLNHKRFNKHQPP